MAVVMFILLDKETGLRLKGWSRRTETQNCLPRNGLLTA